VFSLRRAGGFFLLRLKPRRNATRSAPRFSGWFFQRSATMKEKADQAIVVMALGSATLMICLAFLMSMTTTN
jgi:hypothetical protein